LVISKEDVEIYLCEVKRLILEDRYIVAHREKNELLVYEYVLTEHMMKEILLDLNVEDFSQAVNNKKEEYKEEVLFIFGKEVRLVPRFGVDEDTVELYIKFNKLDKHFLIVVSIHKQEYPMEYMFK